MEIFKFEEVLEQLGSGDISNCSCNKKKKRKNKNMKSMKWSSDIMSEKCLPCVKKKKKKKFKENEYIIEKCGTCGGLKKKKKKNKLVYDFIKEEISPDLFKRTIGETELRNQYKRTYDLGSNFFREFTGKPLFGGIINNIGTTNRFVHIEIKMDEKDPQSNRDIKDIYYNIYEDEYRDLENDPIERKDSYTLSKIALKINPQSKYKQTGAFFKIKGW